LLRLLEEQVAEDVVVARAEVPRPGGVDGDDLFGDQADVVLGLHVPGTETEAGKVGGGDVRHAERSSADLGRVLKNLSGRLTRDRRSVGQGGRRGVAAASPPKPTGGALSALVFLSCGQVYQAGC